VLEIEPMLCDLWSQTQRAELWKTSGELVNLGIDNQPQMSPWKGQQHTWLRRLHMRIEE